MARFSFSVMTSSRLAPMMILSRAASKSAMSMAALSSRVASRAASLTRFARSAPLMPTVPRAIDSRSTSAASGVLRVWTLRISSRPFLVGRSTVTWRSNRPGRSRAGSSTSGRLVAASTITLSLGEKPSISVKIWLSVCSRSSWPPPKPGAADPADGVDLVDEQDAGAVFLGGLEHVADPAGADARRTSG